MYPQQSVYYSAPLHSQFEAPPPLTPLDASYSQLMIPSSLLVGSPYMAGLFGPSSPQMAAPAAVGSHYSHQAAQAVQAAHAAQAAQAQAQAAQLHAARAQANAQAYAQALHHGRQYHAPHATPQYALPPHDALSLLRTVVLKNLAADLSLSQVLDAVEFGPIEHCKLVQKAAPLYDAEARPLQNCHLLFLNSKIAVSFYLRYARSREALGALQRQLHSDSLKVALNESSGRLDGAAARLDFIKLKTLNFIMDHNATRCVKVHIPEEDFANQCRKFGDVDTVGDGEVSFTLIDAAIRCFEFYQDKGAGVSFAKDRCDRSAVESDAAMPRSPVILSLGAVDESIISIPEDASFGSGDESALSEFALEGAAADAGAQKNVTSSLSPSPDLAKLPASLRRLAAAALAESHVPHAYHRSHAPVLPYPPYPHSYLSLSNLSMGSLLASSFPPVMTAPPSFGYNPDPFNVGNRTIYLGNLHPSTSIEDIANNVRAGGIVQLIKYHPEKKTCFVTFVDANVALKFYLDHQVLHQLVIHGYDITVGWARNHSGPLHRDIALAVTVGASRNVYIGIKAGTDEKSKVPLPCEATLRADFSRIGELEQINFHHNKDCGFLNFLNINDAIKLVDCFSVKNANKLSKMVGDHGEFYAKYSKYKISFGKDRCGNPPKFNLRKKTRNHNWKTRHHAPSDDALSASDNLYESDIVNELRETSRLEEEARRQGADRIEEGEEAEDEGIDEEAAMVFGIISHRKEKRDNEIAATIESIKGLKASDEADDGGDGGDDADDADDADSDDEVSIIISSETPKSPQADSKPPASARLRKSEAYPKRMGFSSRNSSNISLNSSYSRAHTKQPHHHAHTSPVRPPSAKSIPYGSGYFGYHQTAPLTPVLGYHPQAAAAYPYMPYQAMAPPSPHYQGYFPPGKSYGTSGSQVMAQYLAQLQHESMLYNAAILSNGLETSHPQAYHKGRRQARR